MTRLFRMLILAALAVVVMPLSAARSATVLACENGADCPIGRFCVTRPGHKLGTCVSELTARMQIACESSLDCPISRFCSISPGKSIGHCVSNPPFSSAAPFTPVAAKIQCQDSLECSLGHHCKIKPGKKFGVCVAP